MKFKIRFADQIVGILSILAIAALIFLMFFIGSKQKWFVPKHYFYTHITSGSSISEGMQIQYKGFGIGKVQSIDLLSPEELMFVEDKNYEVKVSFYISDEYISKVREGSLIEVSVSPIGLGSSIKFHPGLSENLMEDNQFIPELSSKEGIERIANKEVLVDDSVDSINAIVNTAMGLVKKIDLIAKDIHEILNGEADVQLVRTIDEVTNLLGGINQSIQGDLSYPIGNTLESLQNTMQSLSGILASAEDMINNPQGLVPTLLESEDAKGSIDQALIRVKDISDSINSEMPQIYLLISNLQSVLKEVENVVIAVQNIGIINKGVPERTEAAGVTPKLREEEF